MAGDGSRSRLRDAVDAIGNEEFSTLVSAALKASRKEQVQIACKHCQRGGRYWVEVSDPHTAVKSLAALLDQAHGKPAETLDHRVALVARSREEFESLSDEELFAIASAPDAEWSPAE